MLKPRMKPLAFIVTSCGGECIDYIGQVTFSGQPCGSAKPHRSYSVGTFVFQSFVALRRPPSRVATLLRSLLRVKQTSGQGAESVANDPFRHFSRVVCRAAQRQILNLNDLIGYGPSAQGQPMRRRLIIRFIWRRRGGVAVGGACSWRKQVRESECEGSPVFANEMKNDVGDENDGDHM